MCACIHLEQTHWADFAPYLFTFYFFIIIIIVVDDFGLRSSSDSRILRIPPLFLSCCFCLEGGLLPRHSMGTHQENELTHKSGERSSTVVSARWATWINWSWAGIKEGKHYIKTSFIAAHLNAGVAIKSKRERMSPSLFRLFMFLMIRQHSKDLYKVLCIVVQTKIIEWIVQTVCTWVADSGRTLCTISSCRFMFRSLPAFEGGREVSNSLDWEAY